MANVPFQKISKTNPNISVLDIFNLRANPFSFEGALRRHGQYCRIIQARVCPCIDKGQPDMYCPLCNGKGYLFSYQTEISVIEENSPHTEDMKVYPLGIPVTKVIKVDKPLPDYQGGLKNYELVSVDPDGNYFQVCGAHWKEWELIRCSYVYTLLVKVENEVAVIPEAGFSIIVNAPLGDNNTSNPYDMRGDVFSVSSVYNETQDVFYTIKSTRKNTIHLNFEETPIAITDIVKVTYYYIKPSLVVTGRIEENNNFSIPFEEVKEGDLQAVFSAGMNLNKGDIVTFLAGRRKSSSVLKKSSLSSEEIPQFDVIQILEIIDQDGIKYTEGTDFYLFNYNEVKWKSGGSKPSANKKYSVTYLHRPSYRSFRQNADYMNNENKYFIQYAMLRYMNKFDLKEITTI